jgi:hypothetical protein
MIPDTGRVRFRWWLVVVPVVLAALVGGYLWIQYGGSVAAEGRVQVRVSYLGLGSDPQFEAQYVSASVTPSQAQVPSFLHIDRDQAPAGLAKGDVLDCAYLQRIAPIVERPREPVVSGCRRVTG